ncbi:MAG: hypothetical protein NTZ60_07340 [Campylobacterales bacterium]|nr:hypothetical protein [Campylobacterales bacterium]
MFSIPVTVISTVMALSTPTTQINMPTFPSVGIEVQAKNTSTSFKSIYSISKSENQIIFSGEYMNAISTLYSYLSLQYDWDSYGGKAPTFDLISAGEKLLLQCQNYAFKVPKLMLSGSGEIGFYWENGNEYAEITCDNSEAYTFVYMKDKVPFIEEDKAINDAFSSDLTTRISNINRNV